MSLGHEWAVVPRVGWGNQEEEQAEEDCDFTGACAGTASSATQPSASIDGFYSAPSLRILCQLASLQPIIPELKQHKQTAIYSRTISQGQACSPNFGEWFWLRVSHEVTAKLSTAGARHLQAQRAPRNPLPHVARGLQASLPHQLLAGPSSPLPQGSPRGSSHHTAGFSTTSDLREGAQGGRHRLLQPNLRGTCHHFLQVQLVTLTAWPSERGNT